MARSLVPQYDPIKTFESWVSGLSSPDDFSGILSMFNKFDNHIFLRESILYHKGDFSGVIKKMSLFANFQIQSYDSIPWLYKVQSNIGNQEEKLSGLLVFIPGKFPNMYRAVTVSKSVFWNNAIRKLIRRAYPEAMRVFFKQNEIREALKVLENNVGEGFRVHILDGTLKAKRNKGESFKKALFNTDRVWRDQSIDEMFEEALEKSQWFTSLTFAIQKKLGKNPQVYSSVAIGKIGKFGEISSNFYFDMIEEHITSVLEGYAYDRLELYQNRGIRERDYKPSPPLEIKFSFDVFSDIEEIHRFGVSMEKYPDSSIAVFHGNPYYHANIADYEDGSSFDVWILSPNGILIVPQARATPQALERITSHIFYEFREGVVNEYVE